MKWIKSLLGLLTLAVLLAGYITPAFAIGLSITRISRTLAAEADGESGNPAISANGQYAAFASSASNLVGGDTNSQADVFLYRLSDGAITRVSVSSGGAQGDDDSYMPALSADGRYVAFESMASNLVSGDTNSRTDIFVHDRVSGVTSRVSVNSEGTQGFNHSYFPSISADGRYVAFLSDAPNLVSGDNNNKRDLFVHDRQTSQTRRVSVSSGGAQANDRAEDGKISGDGRFVVFASEATNLVASDLNGEESDVFLHDLETGETRLAALNAQGEQGNHESRHPAISHDGRYLVFASYASNLVENDTNDQYDIFRRDLLTGEVILVSLNGGGEQINDSAFYPALSNDGRFVTFRSQATNLAGSASNGMAHIFLRDVVAGQVTHLSKSSENVQANEYSFEPFISGDGRYVTFSSNASNLVNKDGNETGDIFLVNMWQSQTAQSVAVNDGWVLESGENTNKGGSLNNGAATFNLGDDAANRQYRAILHFDLNLPADAVIVRAALRIKKQGLSGTNPFTTHGNILLDIRNGAFGNNPALQTSDFQAGASKNAAATLRNAPTDDWYAVSLPSANLGFLNLNGTTQLRLRFSKDDNNDQGADFLRFYSGNAGAANRPQLIVTYYIP